MFKRAASPLLFLLLLGGCENYQVGATEVGALSGAALGAGLGAIVGNQTGDPGAGVAIGSGIGALAGGLIGHSVESTDKALDEREQRIQAQQRELEENRKIIDRLRARGVDVRDSERGVVVNLPDVLFAFDSATLTASARRTVQEITSVAREYTDRRIAIEGHTDSVGTVQYNQRLSEDRAHSVAAELNASGLPRSRLSVRGYGELRPIASNASASGRQRNRRVEVIIENR